MPAFAYRAVDLSGSPHEGTEYASTLQELTRILSGRGLLVLEIDEEKRGGIQRWLGQRRGLLEATQSLASLIGSGVPLEPSLALAAQLSRPQMQEVLIRVRERVQRGEPVHDALSDHPATFKPVYRGVVRAGERSGDLAGAFERLGRLLSRELELRSRILSASLYPLILAVAGGIAVVLLVLFVLPRFASLLADAGVALPPSTRLLLATSNAVSTFWPVFAFALLGLAVLTASWLTTDGGRKAVARALLAIPGIRVIRRESLAGRFARLTGILVTGGVPLLEALEDTAASIGDPVARAEVERIRFRVREGASLSGTLIESVPFPVQLARLVAVGEESGRLGEFLGKAADLFEGRVVRATERLVTLLEPAMILVFGALVGFVALSLLQAIYGVNAGAL